VAVKHQGKWVRFRQSRECSADRVWIFTDGGVKGKTAGFGAVIVEGTDAQFLQGRVPLTSTRNVGAELNGFLLGLRNVREGAEVTVVSDYLGIAAWMTGNWQIKDGEVRNAVSEAKQLIADKGLLVSFCHHKGHQKDESDFTKWNNYADRLAGGETIDAADIHG